MAAVVAGFFSSAVAGARILEWLVPCLVTFVVVWVNDRLRIWRKPHGVFFTFGVVALIGSSMAGFDWAYDSLKTRMRPGSEGSVQRKEGVAGAEVSGVGGEGVAPVPAVEELVRLNEALNVQAPPASVRRVRVVREGEVLIGNRKFRVAAGDVFALEQVDGERVFFRVDEFVFALARGSVEVLEAEGGAGKQADRQGGPGGQGVQGASNGQGRPVNGIEMVRARAIEEARRRYPKIWVEGSPENRIFVEHARDLQKFSKELMREPDWVLRLADSIAQQEGWNAVPQTGGASLPSPSAQAPMGAPAVEGGSPPGGVPGLEEPVLKVP